jgi:hypothetical protein
VITISAGDGHSFALTENGIKNFFFYWAMCERKFF